MADVLTPVPGDIPTVSGMKTTSFSAGSITPGQVSPTVTDFEITLPSGTGGGGGGGGGTVGYATAG